MKFHSQDTSLRNMTHNSSIPNQNFSILCLFLAEISMKLHSNIPYWEIWRVTLVFQIKFSQFCAHFWLKLVWNFIQKILPGTIWHIALQFQLNNCTNLCFFLAEISMRFHSEDTSLRNMTHSTSIPNINYSILCLFLAEVSMKFHSEDTSWNNMTHNTSIPNQIFFNFVLIFCWN